MVCQRDEERFVFLAADQWTDAYFDFVNPFHARHVWESAGHWLQFFLTFDQ